MQNAALFRRLLYALPLLVLSMPVGTYGQDNTITLFQEWAKVHAQPITNIDEDPPGKADLKGLDRIVGNAKVIAFGEPMHGGHEPLAMRNRIIRYSVTELGVKAVGLESGMGRAKVLYDYVLGTINASDSELRHAFSYGFGTLEENMELIQWLRDYNSSRPADAKIRFYGYDLPGSKFPGAYLSLQAVFTFLDKAAPQRAADLRMQYAGLIKVLDADQDAKLTQPAKDEITAQIQDLIGFLERERTTLTAGSSADDYDWALQEAIAAGQGDSFLRTYIPPQPISEMRELAMAKNVRWIQGRTTGKVLIFAHNQHVQTQLRVLGGKVPLVSGSAPPETERPAGFYLRNMFGADYVVIASLYGSGKDFLPSESLRSPLETTAMFSAAATPPYLIDLRMLPADGALRAWFDAPHAFPAQMWTPFYADVSLAKSYDGLIYLGTVTPSRGSKQFQEIQIPAEDLRQYEGVYRLDDKVAFTVRREENRLTLQRTGEEVIPVFPYQKDRFFGKAIYEQLEFRRDAAQNISTLVLHRNGQDVAANRLSGADAK